jgi:hypothetical protein
MFLAIKDNSKPLLDTSFFWDEPAISLNKKIKNNYNLMILYRSNK